MSNPALDAGIPVLTEIIEVSADPSIDIPEARQSNQPSSVTAHEHQEPPQVVDVPIIDGWLTEEWNRLERKIGGRILHQVMERLELDIEDRVRDALADVLQVAVEALATDIKQNLHHTLQDVISRAVKKEISHMQSSKK